MNQLLKSPILVTTLVAGWCATSALGFTLTNIPPLLGDAVNEGRAISPDGKYVVGLSGTRGFFHDSVSGIVTNVLSSDGAQSTVANGIGYRTSGADTEVIVSGLTSSGPAEFMTTNGGLSFGLKRRNTSLSANSMGVANQLGSQLGSDVYYVSSSPNAQNQPIYLSRGSGAWVATVTDSNKGLSGGDRGIMYGVSALGRAVGRRGQGTTTYKPYVLDYAAGTPTAYNLTTLNDGQNGGNTQLGELWAVSQDGKAVFGRSFLTGTTGDYYSFKTILTGFGPGTQGAVNRLPELAGVGGSTGRSVPYGCSADGTFAVGQNFLVDESAVIWDTSDPDPANWAVTDLTGLADTNSLAGLWTHLSRAYNVGVNASGDPVITGFGTFNGVKSAFLMTVPRWIVSLGSKKVNYGSTATFNLKTNGTDSMSFQWYKNGSVLADGGNVTGAQTASLSMANVSCSSGNAGSYQVVVTDTTTSEVLTSAVVTLTIIDPGITTQPASHSALLGSTTSFSVTAVGSPTLSYAWKLNGNPLSDGLQGSGSTISGATTANLSIANVASGDAGTYAVDISSSAGCASPLTSSGAALTVLGQPVLSTYVGVSSGSYTLNFSGPGGQTYKVLYSTNVVVPLSSWKQLTTGSFSGGADSYTDTTPADLQRFYIIASP